LTTSTNLFISYDSSDTSRIEVELFGVNSSDRIVLVDISDMCSVNDIHNEIAMLQVCLSLLFFSFSLLE
jgi:hypothetical protein